MATVTPAELRRRQTKLRADAVTYAAAAEALATAEPTDPSGYLLGIAHAKSAAADLLGELLEPALKNSPEGRSA